MIQWRSWSHTVHWFPTGTAEAADYNQHLKLEQDCLQYLPPSGRMTGHAFEFAPDFGPDSHCISEYSSGLLFLRVTSCQVCF